jgi:hypothetical protein
MAASPDPLTAISTIIGTMFASNSGTDVGPPEEESPDPIIAAQQRARKLASTDMINAGNLFSGRSAFDILAARKDMMFEDMKDNLWKIVSSVWTK